MKTMFCALAIIATASFATMPATAGHKGKGKGGQGQVYQPSNSNKNVNSFYGSNSVGIAISNTAVNYGGSSKKKGW